MRQATIKKLTLEAFRPFGTFANILKPEGPVIGKEPILFYRDMIQLNLGGKTTASFSACKVWRRPNVVDLIEFHTNTEELILPFDSDVMIHVAPATPGDVVPYDKIEIFLIPKGTLVVLKAGVWHHAPFSTLDALDACLVLIGLPERAYANDCEVVPLEEEQRTKIVS